MSKKLRRAAVLLAALAACVWLLWLGLGALQKAAYPKKYGETVEAWAAEYGVEPHILYAVIRTESGFDPNAVSSVEARGLMQITEETFAWIKLKCAPQEDLTFDDLFRPEVNIRFGGYFFSRCLERYGGDLSTAAAAYHSGWGTVDKLLQDEKYTDDGVTLKSFPYPQMNLYVRKICRNYEKYNEIYKER